MINRTREREGNSNDNSQLGSAQLMWNGIELDRQSRQRTQTAQVVNSSIGWVCPTIYSNIVHFFPGSDNISLVDCGQVVCASSAPILPPKCGWHFSLVLLYFMANDGRTQYVTTSSIFRLLTYWLVKVNDNFAQREEERKISTFLSIRERERERESETVFTMKSTIGIKTWNPRHPVFCHLRRWWWCAVVGVGPKYLFHYDEHEGKKKLNI